ncbi:methyltransferase-like 26 isoform X2 [Rhodnius prolixus]|uniref:methyltransferase-like 26 isoform X2 n=1 Tax=Rhodnius prolixus TaxID=13249 RepID=UPI003D18EABC
MFFLTWTVIKLPSISSTTHHLQGQMSVKHCHPAAERNKEPILQTLKKYIDNSKDGQFLEISSGSGQHVAHIAPNFPRIIFQPSEIEDSSLKSIAVYAAECPTKNIKPPVLLDVKTPTSQWINGTLEKTSLDYILNINMIHISEWQCTEGLFRSSGELLKPSGLLFTYGPYAINGEIKPESNVEFDKSLRMRNPSWGLRDIVRQLEPLATTNNLLLIKTHDLPANNKLLVWQKEK